MGDVKNIVCKNIQDISYGKYAFRKIDENGHKKYIYIRKRHDYVNIDLSFIEVDENDQMVDYVGEVIKDSQLPLLLDLTGYVQINSENYIDYFLDVLATYM